MNIGLLTSSRADYGIYLPLIKKLNEDPFFNLKIIVFGTHLSEKHGKTINQIKKDGFQPFCEIDTTPEQDDPKSISESMGLTIQKFSSFWQKHKNDIDLVLCLGDRYEMFSAITATAPFNIPIAHLHGGETTLGAIDNFFRHSITLLSKYHFTSTENSTSTVARLIDKNENIFNVGALSLDNLNSIKLLSEVEFESEFGIPLQKPILVTFHPETISFEKNGSYADELISALASINSQILITMPNADTNGNMVREKLKKFGKERLNVAIVESLGTEGYFSCLKHCAFVLGNSSSGIIEAASFGKYVINIGDRQLGRETGSNVIHCPINKTAILNAIEKIAAAPAIGSGNIYGNGNTADKIIAALKTIELN